MSKTMPAIALTLAALTMSGCGSGAQDPLVTAVRTLGGGVFGGNAGATPEGPSLTAATLPAELVAQIEGPLLLVETTRLQSSTLMTRVGRNGPDDTWRSPEGYGITLGRGGMLRSTRGLGFDLMTSDTGQTAAALSARRAGPVDRLMVHLDGEGQEVRRMHRCAITADGAAEITIAGTPRRLNRFTETCRIDADRYENLYYLDGDGSTVHSVQWVGPRIGHMRITLLRP